MMDISDRLCKERGLSVIENPGKAPPRAIWERKKKGEKTRYDYYREDIIQAVEMSRTVDAFERYLTRKGYEVDLTGAHWTIKSPQAEHPTYMDNVYEHFTPENLKLALQRSRGFYGRSAPPVLTFSPHLPPQQRTKGFLERLLEGTSIYKLYLYHCYQLGILPKHSEYTPTSPYLKEALQWCDQVSKQVRYMADHGIETMEDLSILSLEIQRMPKDVHVEFARCEEYPYLSVCATGTHDTSPLRAWWEEDRDLTRRFFNNVLGCSGDAPYFCEPWVAEMIVRQHLKSPSMLSILPLQDWLAVDGDVRYQGNPADERINIPANPRHYWRYRMHCTLESLISNEALNSRLRSLVESSGRGK